MKNKIKKYVDDLFLDIYETEQLQELKEEIRSNLTEKINDFIKNGHEETEAFNMAVSSLGNMDELVEGLKKASEAKIKEGMLKEQNIDKKHVIGYVVASVILLLGAMISGVRYLKAKDLLITLKIFIPFLIISSGIFTYFGLTQETRENYAMKRKRAFGYSIAVVILLIGIYIAGFIYFAGNEAFKALENFIPFAIFSVIIFIYLGLTEKSRRKISWEQQWVEYYSDPKSMMIKGNIYGALWIIALPSIPLVGFKLGWEYSWIPFIIAIVLQLLIEAIFQAKSKN